MASIVGAHFDAVPLFMQAVTGDPDINYTAAQFRELNTSIWPSDGVLTATSFHVEQADTPGWSIKVRTGRAVVDGYLVWSFTEQTIDISVFNTNPVGTRTHKVYLVVRDKEAHADDGYYANVRVVEDFGGGVTPPDGAALILLAAFTISPGQTNILNSHIAAKPINGSVFGPFTTLKAEGYLNDYVNDATTAVNSAPARFRYGQGRVHLSGGIMRAFTPAASFVANDAREIGVLPYYLRPYYDVQMQLASSHWKGWRLHIDTNGVMTANIPDDSAPLYLYFDGASYEVD